MRRIMMRVLVLMVPLAMEAGALRAADDAAPANTKPASDSLPATKPATDSLPATKVGSKSTGTKGLKKKDPIEDAFKLPNNRKVEQLSPSQRQAYDQLKQKMTPKLQEALDKVQQASNQNDKEAAAQGVLKVRREIQGQIKKILAQGDPNAKNSPTTARKSNRAKRNKSPVLS